MELRQLEYAVAVADERHFGRAAARLHVAQQSVSEQIQRLERELGGPLFQRTSRRVQLTPVGEAFIPQARDALAQARHALEVGRRVAHGHADELQLGYVANLWPQLTRVALPALAARHPDLRILPRAMHTLEQLRALRSRRLDVALTWHPDPGEDLAAEVLAAEVLAQVPFLAVLPRGHPLAGKQHLARRDLVGQALVALVPYADHPPPRPPAAAAAHRTRRQPGAADRRRRPAVHPRAYAAARGRRDRDRAAPGHPGR